MTTPKTLICPNCCAELPAEDFLEPADFDALEAALEDELERMARGPLPEPTAVTDLFGEPGEEELDELLAQVVDALVDHGLGDTFFEWQGEVAVDRRPPAVEIALSGTSIPGVRRQKNGRLIVEATLKRGPETGGGDGGDG